MFNAKEVLKAGAKKSLRWLAASAIVGTTLTGMQAQPAAAASGPVYWGAYIDGAPYSTAPIDTLESQVGKKMSIVHWGDVHMAGKKGRPLLHQHRACGKTFDPVMTCSQCGEPLNPRQVHVHGGPGAADPRHLPAVEGASVKKRGASARPSRHRQPRSSATP